MSLNLNKQPKMSGGVKQPLIEVGTVPARLVRVIDLGIQAQNPYQGQEKPPAHMVDFTYELLDVFMTDKDGNEDETKPRWISETFPLHNPSADLAKSTKRVKALDPNNNFEYDLTKLVGAPCMVTIGHKQSKGNTYANVIGVTPMRAKDAERAPALKNDSVVFTLDDPDMDVFNKFPDWIKEKIQGNLEYKGSKLEEYIVGIKDGPDTNEEASNEEEENW